MAAASKWMRYDKFPLYMGDNTIDMDDDEFRCTLHASTSNCATLSHSTFSTITNEIAGVNGYTTGGYTLLSVTWTESGGVSTFDSADPQWTASGGSISARFAVIRKVGTANAIVDPVVAVCILDNAPADVTSTDGNSLTIQISASGISTVGGGQTPT